MILIDDIEDPRIAHYATLKGIRQSSFDDRLVVAESEKVVQSLLKSPLEVVSMLALPQYYEAFGKLAENIPQKYIATEELMADIVGYRLHQGVMAAALPPQSTPLDAMEGPVVVLNGLCNAENVGAIMRNALAFGVNNILVDSATSPPFLRRSVRVSMGAVFSMNVHTTENLGGALKVLKERGYTIVGADLTEPVIDAGQYRFPEKYALVIGTEGHGLQEDVVEACDLCVRVPISSQVDSLNAAAATAVLLFAALRDIGHTTLLPPR